MKKLFILSALLLSIAASSFSQDKAADVTKLMSLMQSEKMIDATLGSMIPALKQQAEVQFPGEDGKEKFEQYIEFMMNETKALTKALVNEEMVAIYDKHFTHEDIKAFIAFYESTAGQKMLEKTPAISQDVMTAMMSKHMPEFQQKMADKMQELMQ